MTRPGRDPAWLEGHRPSIYPPDAMWREVSGARTTIGLFRMLGGA